jgi:hypothetical protein
MFDGHGGCDYEWPCVIVLQIVSCLTCSSIYSACLLYLQSFVQCKFIVTVM